MSTDVLNLSDLLPALQNREGYFEGLIHDERLGRRIARLSLWLVVLTFAYGVVMGCYSSWLQAFTAGVKVPVLFFLSVLICFPAFFVIQLILGSSMRMDQMVAIILSGLVLASAIMLSFTPIVVLFMLTGGNYHFLQLLHVAVFCLSGLFGMKSILDALKWSCEEKAVYPQTGVIVFRFWTVILAFVGMQLAWNLRPFLAERDQPFALFRKYEGNLYTAVLYSFQQLTKGSGSDRGASEVEQEQHFLPYLDSTAKP